MRFACDNCGAQYMIADEKIGERGVKVRCKKCSHMIVVRPPTAEESEPVATELQSSAPMEQEQAPAGQMGGAFDAMFGDSSQSSIGQDESTQTYESQLGVDGQSVAQQAFGDSEEHAAGSNGSGMHGAAGFDQDDGGEGAFGFGATAQSGGETDFALGALEREPTGAGFPGSTRPAGEKEWYVAIDDSQVGPIDLAEVEQRWDGRELDEDSLAWKAGMPDWLPIADVPELAYLITERPQSRPSMGASFGNTAATLGGGAGGGAAVVSASFDSSEAPAIDWKPSAASALSSLVEEEIVAPRSEPAPQPAAKPQPALEGMPSFGATDVFGGGNGADSTLPGLGAPGPSASLGGGDVGGGWSVPESRPSGGGNGVMIALVALVLVLVAAVGGGAYYFLVLKPGQNQTGPSTEPSGPVVAQKDEPKEPEKGAESETKEAESKDAAAADEKEPEQIAAVIDNPKAGEPKTRPERNKPRPERTKPRPSRTKPKTDDVDEVFDKPSASRNLPPLTKDDIVEGVKSNGGKLKPCLTAARSKGEILPGRYKFVLNWRIQPSGGVSNASLSGPSEVMGTSLPRCFSRVMSSWKFKPSKAGAPIKNFPLPITVR